MGGFTVAVAAIAAGAVEGSSPYFCRVSVAAAVTGATGPSLYRGITALSLRGACTTLAAAACETAFFAEPATAGVWL